MCLRENGGSAAVYLQDFNVQKICLQDVKYTFAIFFLLLFYNKFPTSLFLF